MYPFRGLLPEYIDYMKLKMYAGRNLTKQDNKTKEERLHCG